MPWLWPEFAFRLSPEGREHERCLKTIHSFTGKVIEDRANDFQLDQVRTKRRAAFLDLLLRQMHEENLTLTDIQEEVDTFMFEVDRHLSLSPFELRSHSVGPRHHGCSDELHLPRHRVASGSAGEIARGDRSGVCG